MLEYIFSFPFRKFTLHATPINPPQAPITTTHFCNTLKKNYPAMAPCRFFAAGKCSYGTSCRNPHILAPPDYTILPNSESSQKGSQSSPRLSTTNYSVPSKTPCWFFTQGKCTHGTTCKNSHDIQPHSGPPFRHENLHAVGGIPGGKEDNQQQEVST